MMSLLSASFPFLSGCDNPGDSIIEHDISEFFFKNLQETLSSDSSPSETMAAKTMAAQIALYKSCDHIIVAHERQTSHQKCVDHDEWVHVCKKILKGLKAPINDSDFIAFLQDNFQAISLQKPNGKPGFMTGYYQPEIKASLKKDETYKYPIYKRPDDLILIPDLAVFNERAKGIRIAGRLEGTNLVPYASRAEINAGFLDGKNLEIAYIKDPVDLFFMHIQGSGKLVFQDGSTKTLFYAATNGKPYTSIGKVLIEQGLMNAEDVTMQSIKKWLRDHPEKAQDILNQNESYVFYQDALPHTNQNKSSPLENPLGAQNTKLTPFASIATDPHFFPLESFIWIETDNDDIGSRFVVAQDVGGAIKGHLRADFYCGSGKKAGDLAGALKQETNFILLKPKPQPQEAP